MKLRQQSTPASVGLTKADRHQPMVSDLTETICRFSPDGTLIYVNEVYCRLFGKTSEELIGRRWQSVVVPEEPQMIEDKLRALSPQNPVVVIETRVQDGQSRMRWMQFVNRGLFNEADGLIEIQSVGRDISERVHAEQKLKESQQRWRFALESSGFGVWDWDVENDRIFFSAQWKTMLGHEPHEPAPVSYPEFQTAR